MGGAQQVLLDMIEELHSYFHFILAVLGNKGDYSHCYQQSGAEVIHLADQPSRWNMFVLFPLLGLVCSRKPDLLLCLLHKSLILGSLAGFLCNKTVILRDGSNLESGGLSFSFPSSLLRNLYRSLYRLAALRCRKIIVLTPSAKEDYHRLWGALFPQNKVIAIPNGIDTDRFSPSLENRINLRQSLNLPPNAAVITMIGRLEPAKDWFVFLSAAQKARRVGERECIYLVVGDGRQRQDLIHASSAPELSHVRILGPRQDIPDILRQSDIFVLTSCSEAFGLVLIEAMAARCPVIATRSLGAEFLIDSGTNGFLVKIGDADAIAAHIRLLLENPVLAERIATNGFTVAKTQFSRSAIARQYQRVFTDELIN
jgi:glycosyltransferase involved in cell wall biosynthesis